MSLKVRRPKDVAPPLIFTFDRPMAQGLRSTHCKACSPTCLPDRGVFPPSLRPSSGSKWFAKPSSFPASTNGSTSTRSRTIRNSTSARISVPSLLCHDTSNGTHRLSWRTDLAATQPYWEGWFAGLSRKFLDAKGGKLLVLAGTDRLDKALMIGQMQGKYQLQVFPEAGHFLHEDQAEKTAMTVAEFYRRNDRNALVLPPKVGVVSKPETSA